jgi:hypothetical protein
MKQGTIIKRYRVENIRLCFSGHSRAASLSGRPPVTLPIVGRGLKTMPLAGFRRFRLTPFGLGATVAPRCSRAAFRISIGRMLQRMSPHLLRWRRRTCTQLARAARNAGLKHRALLILLAAPYPHCESGRFSASTLLPRKSRQGGIRLTADRPAGVPLADVRTGAGA